MQLNPVLQPSSISALRPDIVEVGRFLTPRAFIEFYACVADAGAAGRQLLTRLSEVLPGRTFVAFEVNGGVSGLRNTAGMVNATRNRDHIIPNDYLSPHHRHARWARDGFIVREPMFTRDARRRCGHPDCPGHRAAVDHCPGWPRSGLADAERRR